MKANGVLTLSVFIICDFPQKSSTARKVYNSRIRMPEPCSVLQRLHGCGKAAAAVDEDGGVALVDGHDRPVAQQTAEAPAAT